MNKRIIVDGWYVQKIEYNKSFEIEELNEEGEINDIP